MEDQGGNSKELELMRALFGGRSSNGVSNVNLNAGGFGVWVCACCCIVMLFWNISLRIDVSDQKNQVHAQDRKIEEQDRSIDRMQDHLNAIYMMAPQLNQAAESKSK